MHGFTLGRIANAAPPLLPVKRVIVVIVLASVLAACGGQTPTAPTTSTQAPVASQPNPDSLVVFREPSTGFSTSDLRDASGRIIQLTNGGDLIWTPSGARVSGYVIDSGHWAPPTYFIGLQTGVCGEFCAFSVRFGTEDGQRGAYLTVDYGHNNPGTLVNVEIVGDSIVVTQTSRVPPGTPTLSGVITETTANGSAPIAGVLVSRSVPAGWQSAVTDRNGFYTIAGLIDGTASVDVRKDGYQTESRQVMLNGDTRLDLQLSR